MMIRKTKKNKLDNKKKKRLKRLKNKVRVKELIYNTLWNLEKLLI
jgi:hypothetical protein